jgi:hypothetical protein
MRIAHDLYRGVLVVRLGLLLLATTVVTLAQDQSSGWRLLGWQSDLPDRHLAIVSVDQAPSGAIRVLLKNTTEKPLNAVVIATSGNTGFGVDYFPGMDVPPDGTIEVRLTGQEAAAGDRRLVVEALIFADGSEYGSRAQILQIAGKRLGRILEIERIRQILAGAPEQDVSDAFVDTLSTRVGELPASFAEALESVRHIRIGDFDPALYKFDQKRLRDGFFVGVRGAREDALMSLGRLRSLVERPGDRTTRAALLSSMRTDYAELSRRNGELLRGQTGGAR